MPDPQARDRWAAPTAQGYGIRLGLGLVKGIGEAEGEALDAEVARGGPFTSLADLVARTELAEEIVERLIRGGALDSLGRAAAQAALAAARGLRAARAKRALDRRTRTTKTLDLRLPPTDAPDLPPPSELERLGDCLRDPLARRAPPGDRAVSAGARSAGRSARRRARRCEAGTGEDRRPRRYPAAPDDRARHGLPGARGRDRHGQCHALAGCLGALPGDRPAPRAALRGRAPRARVGRRQPDRRPRRVAVRDRLGRPVAQPRRRACGTWATPACAASA